ncbi:phosphopentomutase-like [Branchiostoma floridae x Branchiostoma belcheri]
MAAESEVGGTGAGETLPSVGDSELDGLVRQWMGWDKTEATRGVLKQLVLDKNVEEIRSRLGQRMAFGTAGLRSRMGMGFSQMNDLTIIQTAQGFLRYLQKTFPDLQKTGIVIGFDSRHNSQRFAQLTAGIFLHAEVPVFLFSKICPTPYVPYSVLHLGCSAGVMVTASHNPKEDNGYKVYWSNGSQITSPHDKGIASSISANLEPWQTSWDVSVCEQSPLCQDPMDRITQAYYQDLQNYCCHRENNQQTSVKFTYTAMHGVGYQFEVQAFQAFSLPSFIPVEEQIKPDPEFPTVKFPNPEEGKSALDLAMQTAEKHGSSVILANDPDADRLAVAERQNGSWKVFTGNELGALLGWWAWQCWRQKNPDKDTKDVWMIASTVSSKILRAIAIKESFNFEETLTGFKWMGNKADELMKKGQTVLLAFEEAIGFMYGTNVLDKDGISASVVMAEMTCWLASQKLSLTQQLNRIFETYGYHTSENSYYICHDPPTITKMFDRMRNWDGKTGQYPSSCGPYKIKNIRDLTAGYDNSKPDNKPVLPTSKASQMITFSFENGCVATLRTSGTEPKIKYYTEMCLPPGTGGSPESVAAELHAMVETMVKELLQPEVNGLIARSG